MAKFNNKWVHGATNFALPPVPAGFLKSAGVFYLHVTLDERVGEEIVLIIYDPTDFIYQLAELTPFNFYTGSLAVNTSFGPVFVFLFWVADPKDPRKVFASFDKPLDISKPLSVEAWRRLGTQTHLHLLLVDRNHEVQGFYEFENSYGFDDGLEIISQLDPTRVLDFDNALQEYFTVYNLEELLEMVRASG